MNLKLETWASSEGRSEQHYYLPKGYEGIYVIGFNPSVLSERAREQILEIVRMDLQNVRPIPNRA